MSVIRHEPRKILSCVVEGGGIGRPGDMRLAAAAELGLGGCMIGSIKRDDLRVTLGIPEQYEILLVLGLGKPKEQVVLENLSDDGSIKYYRDSSGVHHVPKRLLDKLIIKEF